MGAVHAIGSAPDRVETINGHTRKSWLDGHGNNVVEIYLIKGMAHGVPLSSAGKSPLGAAGPFMLDAGISSTARIARTWRIASDSDVAGAEARLSGAREQQAAGNEGFVESAVRHAKSKFAEMDLASLTDKGVGKTITDALRAAGLLR